MKKHNPLFASFPSPLVAAAAVISLVSLVSPMAIPPLRADPPSTAPEAVVPIRRGIPPDIEAVWRKHELAVEKSIAPVQQEINRLPRHAWAGAYHSGSLTPEWLYLAPESGFVRVQYSCVSPPSPQTGAVEVMPTGQRQILLRLRFEDKKLSNLLPAVFTPVRWGERHYLIEPKEMKAFCIFANSGGGAGYLLREGDENKPFSGLPDVPADFQHYLLPHPLEGKVAGVGRPVPTLRKDWFTCEVTVNLGSADGVYQGMRLFSPDARGGNRALLKVTSVDGPHRCRATAVPNTEAGTLPKRGWAISSLSRLSRVSSLKAE